MTEDEVMALAKFVEEGADPIDLETEVTWTRTQLEAAMDTEKQQRLLFRLHKRLLNFDGMKQNEKALLEVRQIVNYCKERLAQLNAKE